VIDCWHSWQRTDDADEEHGTHVLPVKAVPHLVQNGIQI
jgi:hypothetical protein